MRPPRVKRQRGRAKIPRVADGTSQPDRLTTLLAGEDGDGYEQYAAFVAFDPDELPCPEPSREEVAAVANKYDDTWLGQMLRLPREQGESLIRSAYEHITAAPSKETGRDEMVLRANCNAELGKWLNRLLPEVSGHSMVLAALMILDNRHRECDMLASVVAPIMNWRPAGANFRSLEDSALGPLIAVFVDWLHKSSLVRVLAENNVRCTHREKSVRDENQLQATAACRAKWQQMIWTQHRLIPKIATGKFAAAANARETA